MKPSDSDNENAVEAVAEHVEKATAAAREFIDETKASGQGVVEALDISGRVQRHPYGMVAAALGLGYVLGGGLFTRTTARVLRLGVKVAAIPLVRDQLLQLAETSVDAVLERSKSTDTQPEPASSPHTKE